MTMLSSRWQNFASVSLFVLIWGSSAIFTRWGLDQSSVYLLLSLRFALALSALFIISRFSKQPLLPPKGKRAIVFSTGFLLIALYSITYFQSMDHGVTPGLIATIMGAQPILTLAISERRFSFWRLAGLLLAFAGLTMVVYQSLVQAKLAPLGLIFAFAALLCMTLGAILQKRVQLAPSQVLPMQYVITLVMCLAFIPTQPLHIEFNWILLGSVIWLGLVVSVIAQLLLYRMIASGNLVNVTSLFYLVPVITALLDYILLGNRLSSLAIAGMLAILIGLALVFKKSK